METPIGDDDSHLGDFIEDTSVASPIDQATMESLRETTHFGAGAATPREASAAAHALRHRHEHRPHVIGKQFDVTRERIRQIEAKALRKSVAPEPAASSCGFLVDE
ncbi:MAG: sigma factor-like helix-turn-helix DNA-binding protein [Steroidobacteraceae bacterium]